MDGWMIEKKGFHHPTGVLTNVVLSSHPPGANNHNIMIGYYVRCRWRGCAGVVASGTVGGVVLVWLLVLLLVVLCWCCC